MRMRWMLLVVVMASLSKSAVAAPDERLERLKKETLVEVENRAKLTQVMVDSIFSFGELGFQEIETSRFVTGILEENGFSVELGGAGMLTT